MKIAMVEWYPRICGATDWGVHLAAGGIDRFNMLTFSRSGRPLKDWNLPERWQVHKIADAVDVLNQYDLVILTDVVCFAPQVAKGGRVIPYYVEILERMKTPWTTMFHGAPYPSKHNEVIRRVLASKSFTGVLTTLRLPQARTRIDPLSKRPIRYINHPYLPYDRSRAADVKHGERTRAILMTARIAVNKGMNAAVVLMPQLAGPIELWGYNAFGLPSIGWRLYELAAALGYKGKVPDLRDDAKKLTHPRARRFYTGSFCYRSKGNAVRYHRAYVRLGEIDWSPWLHLSLASADFRGILEYATLDAIAAGSIAVVPDHAIAHCERVYRDKIITVPYERCNIWSADRDNVAAGVKGQITGDVPQIVSILNNLLKAPEKKLRQIAKVQHDILVEHHDPKKILKKMVKETLK